MSDVQTHHESDALDALIGEERTLIDRFDTRKSNADTVTAAAVTGVLALAALAGTAAQTIEKIDKTFAWIVVGVLAAVPLVALWERFVAGLRPDANGLTSRSTAYNDALVELRKFGPTSYLDPGPSSSQRRSSRSEATLCNRSNLHGSVGAPAIGDVRGLPQLAAMLSDL